MLVRLSGKMLSGRLPNGLTDQDAVWARPRVGRRNRVLNGVRSPQRGPGAQLDLEIDRVERIDSTRLKIDRLDRSTRLASHCL